jgi:hypothetical protein
MHSVIHDEDNSIMAKMKGILSVCLFSMITMGVVSDTAYQINNPSRLETP